MRAAAPIARVRRRIAADKCVAAVRDGGLRSFSSAARPVAQHADAEVRDDHNLASVGMRWQPCARPASGRSRSVRPVRRQPVRARSTVRCRVPQRMGPAAGVTRCRPAATATRSVLEGHHPSDNPDESLEAADPNRIRGLSRVRSADVALRPVRTDRRAGATAGLAVNRQHRAAGARRTRQVRPTVPPPCSPAQPRPATHPPDPAAHSHRRR